MTIFSRFPLLVAEVLFSSELSFTLNDKDGSFLSNKIYINSLSSSQSKRALCLVLLEISILKRLQRLSSEFEEAGNFDRAKLRVSSTFLYL